MIISTYILTRDFIKAFLGITVRVLTSSNHTLSRFKSHRAQVVNSRFGTSNYHSVLAAYLIACERVVRCKLSGVRDNVEIGQSGFDHDDIGPFCYISLLLKVRCMRSGPKRLERTYYSPPSKSFSCRRKLVAFTIAKRRRTACSISATSHLSFLILTNRVIIGNSPERPIQSTRKFGGIAHQRTFIAITIVNESPLDRFNSPVHHIAWGDTMCARLCIRQCDLCDASSGRFRVDRSICMQDTAMTVRGVFTEANVACDV